MPDPLAPRNAADHPPLDTPQYRSTLLRAPSRPPVMFPSTPTEDTGPTFGHDLIGAHDNDLITNFTGKPAIGERILVHGRVLDGIGRAIPETLVEVWQANAGGRYRHAKDTYFAPLDPDFAGCGRTLTDADGYYRFMTIRPGAYPWPNGGNNWRPMHIHFSVFGSGFGQRLISQMYFQGDPLIDLCPIANTVRDRSHLETLVAPLDMKHATAMDHLAYRFDIVLRGPRQNLFENKPE
ncbi:unnamed protein product, partial [Ectocarpus sp. 12 AP-2014]